MHPPPTRQLPAAEFALVVSALALCLAAPSPGRADDLAPESLMIPTSQELEQAHPEGERLSGREIYERYLANKHRKSVQHMRVISRDPGGSEQTTNFKVSAEDFRNGDDEATNGVLAKMLVEVSAPFDMRNTSYLMIAKDPGPDDEFIYQPSGRRVRRIALKTTPLMGTDYTFDDIAYHDIEYADYLRLPDEVLDGTPVYVVESTIKDTRNTEYHRSMAYLEKEHCVPLRVRYWDDFGVEIKEMRAELSSVQLFDEIWIARESTMYDLLQRTSSTLHVDSLERVTEFPKKLFSLANLTKGS